MEKWLKRTVLGMGLLVSMASLAMSSIELLKNIELEKRAEIQKNDALGSSERTKLYRLVTFDWLDTDQLLSNKRLLWSINAKDCDGRTPLHHLMMHLDASVELVKHFTDHGARLTITNEKEKNAYDYLIEYHNAREDVCYYEIANIRKMINIVHWVILKHKLSILEEMLISRDNQSFLKNKSKKSSFYVIR